MRFHHLSAALVLSVALLGGCSNDDDKNTTYPDPWLEVYEAPQRTPAAGLKIVAMDPATNGLVMAAVTDSSGRAAFPGLPTGNYQVLVYGGPTHNVVSLPPRWEQRIPVDKQMPDGGLLSPLDKTSPLPLPPEILVERRLVPGDLPRIAGKVFDAVTGAPLAGAFVGVSPTLTGYTGLTTYKDDVTLDDGSFVVHEIVFARDPITNNFTQLEPLLVSREGYRPRLWRHNMANGDDNLDIRNRRIELLPLTAEDTGAVRGRMLRDGVPLAGVVVGLGGGDFYEPDKSGPGLPGQIAVTDEGGKYTFVGLAAGRYFVQGGFLSNDGHFQNKQSGDGLVTVTQGETTNAGDRNLLHEIDLYYPPNGWEYFGAEWIPVIEWSPVEGAAYYKVVFAGLTGQTEEPSISLPDDLDLAPGGYPWGVTAHDADDAIIGANEVAGLLYIVEPDQ